LFVVLIRTTILYLLVVITMRLMGKRQVAELQPYELVIAIMISDLASLPMQDQRLPLFLGIIPILTLLFLKTILNLISLKFQCTRKFIDGEPCILIYKGKINYNALKEQQIDLDELFEQMRIANYFNLDEIQYAILENNGQLSILPSNYNDSYTFNHSKNSSSNNQSKIPEVQLPKILIADGKINSHSLNSIDKNEEWIISILNTHNITDPKQVLIALLDTKGHFKYQLFDEYERSCKK